MTNPAPRTRGRDGRDVLEGLEDMTPGPWAKIDGNGYGLPQVAIAPDGKSVAGTTFHRKGREAEANARAIARVPDLIAEVEALREGLRKALRLPDLLLMSEERSSAHSHGPRRAAEYDRRYHELLEEVRSLLPTEGDTHD